MKPGLPLLALAPLYLSLVYAAPYNEDQVILGNVPFHVGAEITHSVLDAIEEGKKEILKGKANMQKWLHAGKEYIKQDDMLCKLSSWRLVHRLVDALPR
jgi:cathepsin A (carboxypeptidase C)